MFLFKNVKYKMLKNFNVKNVLKKFVTRGYHPRSPRHRSRRAIQFH